MRLRQIVLVARDIDRVEDELASVFGWKVAYRDPLVGKWGLRNIVVPVADDFLEVVSPTEENTSACRHLDRIGGDGGYMLLFQVGDRDALTRRLVAQGVRVAYANDQETYRVTQFHPADCGGVMLSWDQVLHPQGADWTRPGGYWYAARGLDWLEFVATGRVGAIRKVKLSGPDAGDLAALYGRLLDRPVAEEGGAPAIRLHGPDLGFAGGGMPGTIARIDLQTHDGDAVRKAAASRGLLDGDEVTVCGVRFRLV